MTTSTDQIAVRYEASSSRLGLALVFAGPVAGFIFGVIQETASTSNGVFWLLALLSLGWAAVAVRVWRGFMAGFRDAAWVVPVVLAMQYGLVLGDFSVYATGIDSRTIDEYGLDIGWLAALSFSVVLGTVFGVVLGLIGALASFSLLRDRSR